MYSVFFSWTPLRLEPGSRPVYPSWLSADPEPYNCLGWIHIPIIFGALDPDPFQSVANPIICLSKVQDMEFYQNTRNLNNSITHNSGRRVFIFISDWSWGEYLLIFVIKVHTKFYSFLNDIIIVELMAWKLTLFLIKGVYLYRRPSILSGHHKLLLGECS